MITFDELLKARNFNFSENTLLVRHKQKGMNMFELIEKGYFEMYQSTQVKRSFEKCKYMIVFIGLEATKALFYNVYEITGSQNMETIKWPDDYPFPEFIDDKHTFYNLKPLTGFEDLQQRVIIDWGQGTLAWVQKYIEKEVIEILPKGYVKEFPNYLDFTLSYTELKKLFDFPEANKLWKDKLSSVNGIYLILDKKTGLQYIGSAYGKDGIWGRWSNYSKTGHGNNKLLVELVENDETYKKNFQWTILSTLPGNLTKDEIIHFETIYKEKFGSRTFGLNEN
jgi:hypothetical protein